MAGGKVTAGDLQNANAFNDGATHFLDNQNLANNGARPKAYLNWIVFDEQFNLVSSSSGFEQVPAESVYDGGSNGPVLYTHVKSNMPIDKNGFLYIYVSNETPNIDVFFDNLQVTHTRGPILEETHYYPFGLTMVGISSKSALGLKNKKGYNGNELQSQEFSDGNGLELYDFNARTYDQQLGRYLQIDPKCEEDNQELVTPYHFCFNNPILHNDPDGRVPVIPVAWGLYRAYQLYRSGETIATILKGVGKDTRQPGEILVGVNGGKHLAAGAAVVAASGVTALATGAAETGNSLVKVETGQAAEQTGSIYKVPGSATTSGKPYIGRHNQPDPAKTRKSKDGRDRTKAEVVDKYDPKNPQQGRQKEQDQIDQNGGVSKLDNKRNEIKKDEKKN